MFLTHLISLSMTLCVVIHATKQFQLKTFQIEYCLFGNLVAFAHFNFHCVCFAIHTVINNNYFCIQHIFVGGVFFRFASFASFHRVLSRCTMWPTVGDQYSLLFSLGVTSLDCNCVRDWNVRVNWIVGIRRYTRIPNTRFGHIENVRTCSSLLLILLVFADVFLPLISMSVMCDKWWWNIRTFRVYVCTRSRLLRAIAMHRTTFPRIHFKC